MIVGFTKVEGLGNDFVLIDGRTDKPPLDGPRAVALCDRHRGIGADGVLLLSPSSQANARLEIWNADGSRSEMCGNGLRCAAQQLFSSLGRKELRIETLAGVHRCRPDGDNVWVELVGLTVGEPETLTVGNRRLQGRALSLGNPHFVTREGSLDEIATLGPAIETHPRFAPGRTNVELCEVRGTTLRIRVWERGAGLTEACGTGAGAAAAAAWADGVLPRGLTRVELPGGTVQVEPLGTTGLGLLGPARQVFEGRTEI